MVQSAIGDVAAGSLFAILQSAAMGGYGAAVATATIQLGAGVMGAILALSNILKGKVDGMSRPKL